MSAYHAQLLRDIDEVNARASSIAGALDDRQLDWTPPGGGWSIGQVLEHLVLAHDAYLANIRVLLARQPTAGAVPGTAAPAGRPWKGTLGGRLLAHSLRSPRRLPAPRVWQPAPQPRPQVLAEFLLRQEEIAELIDATAALDWRRLRTASPVSSLIRLNLGDCFGVMVEHARRHTDQMERIRARPEFPASAA